jgi:hypothetical protein
MFLWPLVMSSRVMAATPSALSISIQVCGRCGSVRPNKRHPQVGNQLDPLIMWAEGREYEAVDPFGADKLLDLREWVTRRGKQQVVMPRAGRKRPAPARPWPLSRSQDQVRPPAWGVRLAEFAASAGSSPRSAVRSREFR